MGEVEAGKCKAAGICGILIGVCGLALFIVGCMWAGYGGGDGNGIWCGFLLLLQAILGIVAWMKTNKLAMVFYLVLAILNTILCIVQAAIAAIAWLIWQIVKAIVATKCTVTGGSCVCTGESIPLKLDDCDAILTIEALFICMVIIAGIACIVCFASSIIGCMAVCCASQPAQTNVVVVQQPAIVAVQHGQQQQQQQHQDPNAYPMQ